MASRLLDEIRKFYLYEVTTPISKLLKIKWTKKHAQTKI